MPISSSDTARLSAQLAPTQLRPGAYVTPAPDRYKSALMSADGDGPLSAEALTNATNQNTATIASVGTELGNITNQLSSVKHDVAQLELVMEQLPSQINNGLSEIVEAIAGPLTAKVDSVINTVGGISSPPSTPATIKDALSPAKRRQSLSNFGMDWFTSELVKANAPFELI